MLGRQQSAPHREIWDAGGDVLGVPEPVRRHSDAAGAMRISGAWRLSPAVSRGPGSGQKDSVSCGGVGTWRRGRGDSGRRRGELQVPGLRDPAGWGAPGTATRCHPRAATASRLPGTWQLRLSCLRGQLRAWPGAERSHRERLHPGPPRPRRDAWSAARRCLAQGHPAGGWHRGTRQPGPVGSRVAALPFPPRRPRFAPALSPPPNFAPAPNLSPLSLPDVPVGSRWVPTAAWRAGSCQGRARAAGFGGDSPLSPLPEPRAPRLLGLPSRGSFPTSRAAALPWRSEPWGAVPAALDVPPFPRFSGPGAEREPALSPTPVEAEGVLAAHTPAGFGNSQPSLILGRSSACCPHKTLPEVAPAPSSSSPARCHRAGTKAVAPSTGCVY